MFEKSRRKIVAAIMSILILLWVGTLGVIYASSYFEMTRRNTEMLKAQADMYEMNFSQPIIGMPPNIMPPIPNKPGFITDSPIFQLSTFYSVALTDDGKVLEIKNEQPAIHSDEELEKLSLNILESSKISGHKNGMSYYKALKSGYTLVVFMDNTFINESATTLFRYTHIFGAMALVVFFFISVYFARKIVNPLEENYKKQKQFISDAGHELKTPVSVVNANAELLSREIGNNQWLDNILYENERMGVLVGQLLELARTENVTPVMEQIDLSRLCNGEALPFESVAYEKGISIISNISKGITIQGNAAQLKQLVSILIDNALRHSKDAKEIYLSLSAEHKKIRLSVVNKGQPIPEDERSKIFERFYRVDTARNSEDNHYGLGLAIAKSIVETHKGTIQVHCNNGYVEFRAEFPNL